MLTRLISAAALLAVAGCSFGHPLQIQVDGAGFTATASHQGENCVSTIHVVLEGPRRPWPDVWTLRASPDECVRGFPQLRYGQVPPGMVEDAPAAPLVPGREYWITGWASEGNYMGHVRMPRATGER